MSKRTNKDAKDTCTWLTKEEREENLAALAKLQNWMKGLNINPTEPKKCVKNKKTKNGGNKKNNKTKNKK